MSGGWQAHVVKDQTSFNERLVIFRRFPDDTVEYVTGEAAGGVLVIARADADTRIPDNGLVMPWQMIEAIGSAIAPGPTGREMALVQEALAVERARVDAQLAKG